MDTRTGFLRVPVGPIALIDPLAASRATILHGQAGAHEVCRRATWAGTPPASPPTGRDKGPQGHRSHSSGRADCRESPESGHFRRRPPGTPVRSPLRAGPGSVRRSSGPSRGTNLACARSCTARTPVGVAGSPPAPRAGQAWSSRLLPCTRCSATLRANAPRGHTSTVISIPGPAPSAIPEAVARLRSERADRCSVAAQPTPSVAAVGPQIARPRRRGWTTGTVGAR
jgi:hypothetical protein